MANVSSPLSYVFLFFFFYLELQCSTATAKHIITPAQSISDGETLTSSDKNFELGFFSPGKSSNRYVGIWLKNFSNIIVVWVANRETPLKDSFGVLAIGGDGNLVLLDGTLNILWSTNVSVESNSSTAMLSDQGNLVLNNSYKEGYLWQSFDHPCNTFLEGMKLGINGETGEEYYLTAWKSEDDPSTGNFTSGGDYRQVYQGFVFNGSMKYWRTGQWSGSIITGIPDSNSTYLSGWQWSGGFLSFSSPDKSVSTMVILGSSGISTTFNLYKDDNNNKLSEVWKRPKSQCDIYGMCGPFGACSDNESPICGCLRGFEPKFKEEWSKGIWNNGCVRKAQLQCKGNQTRFDEGEDGFFKIERVKLPDFSEFLVGVEYMGCEAECLRNCSCIAFAYVEKMCLYWGRDLVDIQKFSYGGSELSLRLAHSELGKKGPTKLIAIIVPIVGLIVISALVLVFPKVKAQRRAIENYRNSPQENLFKDGVKEIESPTVQLFDNDSVAIATNNFNMTNKLGEGGFGPVYKCPFERVCY